MKKEIAIMLPVFNAMPFLDSAILSLLAQDYREFTIYAYDDYSDDGSYERLKFWQKQDDRIILERPFSCPGNYTNIVNQQIEDAKEHKYLARMDADDMCMPHRLTTQRNFMELNPDAVLCGTQGANIIERNNSEIVYDYPWESKVVNPIASYHNPVNREIREHHRIIHGTFFSRRDALQKTEGYIDECFPIEDWELSLQLSQLGGVFVLPTLAYLRRIHETNSSKDHPNKERAFAYINRKHELGLDILPRSRPKNL